MKNLSEIPLRFKNDCAKELGLNNFRFAETEARRDQKVKLRRFIIEQYNKLKVLCATTEHIPKEFKLAFYKSIHLTARTLLPPVSQRGEVSIRLLKAWNDRGINQVLETGPELVQGRTGSKTYAAGRAASIKVGYPPLQETTIIAAPFISEEDSFKIWMKTGDSEILSESNGDRRYVPLAGVPSGVGRAAQSKEGYPPFILIDEHVKPIDFEKLKAMLSEPMKMRGQYKDRHKVKNFTPDNWPASAPSYHSAEGWAWEKAQKARDLKSWLTISWLIAQGTERHKLIADRLIEITESFNF